MRENDYVELLPVWQKELQPYIGKRGNISLPHKGSILFGSPKMWVVCFEDGCTKRVREDKLKLVERCI